MLGKSEILKNFFEDMIKLSKKDGFFRFGYQSRSHWMLMCLIGSEEQNGISFEELCHKIDRKLVSRSTIQNILDNGTKLGVFQKEPLENDRRVQLYRLSLEATSNVDYWIKRQKEIFA